MRAFAGALQAVREASLLCFEGLGQEGEGDVTTLEIRVENTWEGREPVVRHGAQFQVTLDVLAEMFGLPEGARVVGVWAPVGEQIFLRSVRVMVEHPDLPEVLEGATPVEISPTFDDGKLTDWGV